MLRKVLPLFLKQPCRPSLSRNYIAAVNEARTTEESALEALNSSEPLNAYPIIQTFRKHGEIIPANVMNRLYEVTKGSSNAFYAHLFASLVTVDQVGRRQFQFNVERVIKLQLALQNWEPCIEFIREVELVNQGSIVLSYDTLEALILSAKWHGDVEIAFQAAKLLHETYSSVYARTWGLIFQLALDINDYDCLKWIFKSALVPGYLVVDDASYVRIAAIAAQNGDLRMCEWSSLRMRRRQRALKTGDASDSLRLYIYLIEAAARSSVLHTDDKFAPSFKAVCRYLVKLGPLGGEVSIRDLPQTVQALCTSKQSMQQLYEMFEGMCSDASVCKEAKTLTFNLLLSAALASRDDVGPAMELAHMARSADVEFNEDSITLLLDVAHKGGADAKAFDALVVQCPTARVINKAKVLCEPRGIDPGYT